jgi:hypothetical protein
VVRVGELDSTGWQTRWDEEGSCQCQAGMSEVMHSGHGSVAGGLWSATTRWACMHVALSVMFAKVAK